MGWKNRSVFDVALSDAENDNIGAFLRSSAGNLLTSTTDGAIEALDVQINNANIEVTQGTSPWVIGDGGGSITVDAVDLDIRDLAFATDKVDVSGSEVSLDSATLAALETITVLQGTSPWVIGDGGGSITVDAVDLDIRDLDAASDSVAAWTNDGSGNPISSTSGALNVFVDNDISIDIDGVYDVGTNPTPDNVGIIGHVRNAAPGDAQQTFRFTGGAASSDDVVAANVQGLDSNSFMMAYDGTNWDRVRHRNNELLVNDVANSAVLHTQKDVTTTSGALLASALSNRKNLLIQNFGSGIIYIGASGVNVATGFPISSGSVAEFAAGPGISLHAVTNTGTRDARILELS